jgi:hypothetical protein
MTNTPNIELFKFTKNQQVGQIGLQNPSKQTNPLQKTDAKNDVSNALATGNVTGQKTGATQTTAASQNEDAVLNDDHEYLDGMGVNFSSSSENSELSDSSSTN